MSFSYDPILSDVKSKSLLSAPKKRESSALAYINLSSDINWDIQKPIIVEMNLRSFHAFTSNFLRIRKDNKSDAPKLRCVVCFVSSKIGQFFILWIPDDFHISIERKSLFIITWKLFHISLGRPSRQGSFPCQIIAENHRCFQS